MIVLTERVCLRCDRVKRGISESRNCAWCGQALEYVHLFDEEALEAALELRLLVPGTTMDQHVAAVRKLQRRKQIEAEAASGG